jgi:hypothetical protein
MMTLLRPAVKQARLLIDEVLATPRVPWPIAKMMRNGFAIGVGFLGLLLAGKIEGALICAFFTNLLMFADQPGHLRDKLIVIGSAAAAGMVCGICGALVTHSLLLVFAGTFCLALLAGLIHGSVRGIDTIPRYAAICFVAGAYLPVVNEDAVLGAGIGSLCALAAVAIDNAFRRRDAIVGLPMAGFFLVYPGSRFSLAYGLAAVCGLALGQAWGDTRPYWLTITTLLVMQPDRRTNMFRALQRFLGTIIGVLAAFAIVLILPEGTRFSVIVVFGLITPFIWPLAYARNYALGVSVLSLWILLLLDLALPPSLSIGVIFTARLQDTAVGCVLALIGAFIYNESEKAEQR